MKVEIYSMPMDVNPVDFDSRTAVVIDVLRASTSITIALQNGCREIVPTDDVDNAGKYIDAAVDAGANIVNRIDFTLSDDYEEDVKRQAMIQASDDAEEKAVALTSNLGVRLGSIVSISESSYSYSPYRYYGTDAMMEAGAADVPTKISPEKVDVRGSVSLVYEIK